LALALEVGHHTVHLVVADEGAVHADRQAGAAGHVEHVAHAQMGAEALLGMGDMLYMASGTGLPVRVHGAFVSDDEVHRVVEYLKSQGEPNYIEGVLEGGTAEGDAGAFGEGGDAGGEKDPMYDQAVEVVLKNRKASISLVQRHLKIGYNRAARLVEDMENAGLVSAMTADGKRDILVPARPE
ncbi:MAG: hypothetical protein E6Q65_08030, partial [Ottowia sp.]